MTLSISVPCGRVTAGAQAFPAAFHYSNGHLEKLAASSLAMAKTVIAEAGNGSEENYLYAVGEEKELRFDFLIPYGMYLKEKSRSYKKNIKHAKNWNYNEKEDHFICPNGRKVGFEKYLKKKNASGYEQSLKVYEWEDCSDCPLKALCTKAKGNRQVQWNPIFEEIKPKQKQPLNVKQNHESTHNLKLT